MRRPLLHLSNKFGLALIDTGSTVKAYYPIFRVPVLHFLNCGAVWTVLNLCTIFWERPAYGIERSVNETERIKKAYLLAFANYDAPISKAWAEKCLLENENENTTHEPYFELIIYNPALVEEIKGAFQRHGIKCIHGEDNFITVLSL